MMDYESEEDFNKRADLGRELGLLAQAMKQFEIAITAALNYKFGRWELPDINIGGRADYTPYCLN